MTSENSRVQEEDRVRLRSLEMSQILYDVPNRDDHSYSDLKPKALYQLRANTMSAKFCSLASSSHTIQIKKKVKETERTLNDLEIEQIFIHKQKDNKLV
jgi:hypothetical protein